MKSPQKRLQKNIRLLYAVEFFTNSYFTLPINIFFGKEYLGLSFLAAGSLVFADRLTSFIFDFLGGAVADHIGRKQANVIGISIQIACFIPFLITRSYPILLISVAISGIGAALSSNSIDSLIYEEAKSIHQEKSYQKSLATVLVSSTEVGFTRAYLVA
jgi:MFS family permease